MAITLNPKISDLGIMAPVIGPWFSNATLSLPALPADSKLGMDVAMTGVDWFAPATGTLSLYISNATAPPPGLDALQDATGAFPFADGRLVAHFRLLPEVEARLHALVGLIPAATVQPIGTTLPTSAATPTRAQVRSFAIVLPEGTALTTATIEGLFGGQSNIPGDTDIERMAAVGLVPKPDNSLVNATLPMTWLRRPGQKTADRDRLLQGLNGTIQLWAFDQRGRAIDPGAVACWWSWLLATGVGADSGGTLQLLPPSFAATNFPQSGSNPVVAQFAAQRSALLSDPHEGPPAAPFLAGRLKNGATAIAKALVQATGSTGISLSVTALPPPGSPAPPADNPPLDALPRARMAVLPAGSYATTLSLWPGGAVHSELTRDFVRVGLVEEESHLVGVLRRDSRAAPSSALERRQSAQNRPSTRINVSRTADTASVLLANTRAVADALLALPGTAAPTRMVLGIADAVWGGTPSGTPPAPGAGPLPASLAENASAEPGAAQYRVRALTGGGALAEDKQTVLVEINLGAPCAGAWVRAWAQGFDLDSGNHFALTGGAGRASDQGLARLPMTLANGRVDPLGLLAMDLLVLLFDSSGAVTTRRHYADLRFARPAPIAGAAPAPSGTFWVCETAATGTGALPSRAVPPGGHVILLSDPPAIVDRTTLPASAWDAATLRNKLQATDIVSLTAPSCKSTPDRADGLGRPLPHEPSGTGDAKGGLDAVIGNHLHLLERGLAEGASSSAPYALLDRLEVAAAAVATGNARAVIGSTSPAPWALEPTNAMFLGFPTVPASIEVHGAGAALNGLPAVAVAEYVRERTAGMGFDFVRSLSEPARSLAVQSEIALAAEAATPFAAITEGTGAGPVAAILRTGAFGLEGVPGAAVGATATDVLFPFGQNLAALEAWLDNQISAGGGAGSALRSAAGSNLDSVARALDRRILASAFGARETLIALMAAIDRAQDLIYIETPALDGMSYDGIGETMSLWTRVMARLGERKGLRVVLCVPTLLAPGTPKMMQAVRDQVLLDAITTARNVATDRFGLFSPGVGAGRALRLASTSVVIDDAFALTGTTHLSRRGLTWDSSLAASVFDERLVDGRPQDVRAFRIRLLADRLGIATGRVPDDPADLVRAVQALDANGSERLSVTQILRPDPVPQNLDIDIWNPDGSKTDLTLSTVAALFASAIALTDVDHAIIEG